MTIRGEEEYFSRHIPGKLLKNWDTPRLSSICTLQNGSGLSSKERDDGENPVFGSNGKVGNHSESLTSSPVIIIGRKGSAGAINYSESPAYVIDTAYYVDPEHAICDIRWLYYFLSSLNLNEHAEHSAVPGINRQFVEEHRVPLPEKEYQERIAGYLDKKTEGVDIAIEKLHQLKKLAHERKKTTIQHAVKRGIKKDSTLVDSNEGWLGTVPDHWDVVRTRFVAQLESGHTPSRSNDEYWEDTNIPWVTTSDIKPFRNGQKIHLDETENQISELGLENSGAHLLPERTVFLSRTASVGFSGIMNREMATSQDFANWICSDEILPEYLLYVFRSMDQEFDRLTQGSTHQTIYMPDIQSFKTPLPPVAEQREIVEHIQTETDRIWELIDKVEETIDLLKEKRQALIKAAVTGQIDITETQSLETETVS